MPIFNRIKKSFKRVVTRFGPKHYKSSGSVKNKPLFITDKRRAVNAKQIRLVLEYNAVELVFKRRIFPPKRQSYYGVFNKATPIRRMFCTGNWRFLVENKNVFGYKRSSRKRSDSWYRERGLILVYDLIVQKYRMISLDDYSIMNTFPLEYPKDKKNFIDKYVAMGKKKSFKSLTKLFNK